MTFTWVTIQVNDMEKSIQFYEKLAGLTLDRRFSPAPGMELAFLKSDETNTEIELMKNKTRETLSHSNDISLGFMSVKIEEIIAKLKEFGISEIEGPFQPNPSLKFIYAKDPDGVKIQFIEDQRVKN